MWINLHNEWHKIKYITISIIWTNVVLLFFSSFFPYVTSFVTSYYNSSVAQGWEPSSTDPLHHRFASHCILLRCRSDVWSPDTHGHRRVLALVGRASLGRRVLRGIRYGCCRLPLLPSGATTYKVCHDVGTLLYHHLPSRWYTRYLPPPLLQCYTYWGTGSWSYV